MAGFGMNVRLWLCSTSKSCQNADLNKSYPILSYPTLGLKGLILSKKKLFWSWRWINLRDQTRRQRAPVSTFYGKKSVSKLIKPSYPICTVSTESAHFNSSNCGKKLQCVLKIKLHEKEIVLHRFLRIKTLLLTKTYTN